MPEKLIVERSHVTSAVPETMGVPELWHTAQLGTFVAAAPGAPRFALDALELLIRRAAMRGDPRDFVVRANGRVALDDFLRQRNDEMDGFSWISVEPPLCVVCGAEVRIAIEVARKNVVAESYRSGDSADAEEK